jgi:hypothetical protein
MGLLISNVRISRLNENKSFPSYRWRSQKKIIASSQNSKKIYFNMTDIAKMLLDNYSKYIVTKYVHLQI